MTPRPNDTASLLARLDGVCSATLAVAARRQVGASVVEVVLHGDVAGIVGVPGNDVMLAVPIADGDGSFRRRYTIRAARPEAGEIVLWIDTTAGGPGASWASCAPIGSTIEAIGPRGKVVLDELADWHLFIGDTSFLPAAYAMAAAIEAPGQALFVIETDHEADQITPSLDEGIGVTLGFIDRDGRRGDDPAGLLAGLAALELPEDEGHAYIGGELRVVQAVRAALVARGVAPEKIDAKPYWRLGRSNEAHGEPDKS
jgi:NADPH-dependent ferric siderophore reductase